MPDIQKADPSSDNPSLQEEHLQLTKKFFYMRESWISITLFVSSIVIVFIGAYFPTFNLISFSLSTILVGVGASLLASIFFAKRYEKMVRKWETKVLSEGIAEELEDKLEDVKQANFNSLAKFQGLFTSHLKEIEENYCTEIYKNFDRYLPKKQFPYSSEPDPKYNKTLTQAFTETNHYYFRGVQGLFIPIRLENLHKERRNLKYLTTKVLLFDPRDEKALEVHAIEVYKKESLSVSQKLNKIKESIYQAIVGLYDIKDIAKIELGVYSDSIFYRSEIFDNSIFVTYYNQRLSFGDYPPSYYFEKQSIYYDIFQRDFLQTWDIVEKKVKILTIKNDLDESKLEEYLKEELRCNKSIEELRKGYEEEKNIRLKELAEYTGIKLKE